MNTTPFLTGYASEVWVQRETSILQPTGETAFNAGNIAGYSIQPITTHRLTSTGPARRRNAYRTLQGAMAITLRFELRSTSAICELLRSLLSLSNVGTNPVTNIETRTWEPEFTDEVHTLKIGWKDMNTREGFTHEGVAVSDCVIAVQSRALPIITFTLIALRSTSSLAYTGILVPGTLREDQQPRANFSPVHGGAFFSQDNFLSGMAPNFIGGNTRMSLELHRDLAAVAFRGKNAKRFTKSPCEFNATLDCYVSSYLRYLMVNAETYGQAILQFGESADFLFQANLQNAALTFDLTSLHSSASENIVTANLKSIQDLTETGASMLSLLRMSEGFDGGEFFDNDIPQIATLDGGDLSAFAADSNIDGGTF